MVPDHIRAVWAYRGFVLGSVKREFQTRYRNSLLGAAWTIINPVAMITVYTVIFSQVMQAKLPQIDSSFAYSIYLCSGILTWGYFAEIIGRSQSVFLENANLLKKLSFPRMCLPVIVVCNASVNFLIIFLIFIGFLLISGNLPGIAIVAFLPVLLIQVALAVGIGMIAGVLNVFFRDVGQFVGILLQFWFWFTPIVYPASILPDDIRELADFNPMLPIMQSYQNIFVYDVMPDWNKLLPVTLLALAACILGMRLFQKRSGELVDEL